MLFAISLREQKCIKSAEIDYISTSKINYYRNSKTILNVFPPSKESKMILFF